MSEDYLSEDFSIGEGDLKEKEHNKNIIYGNFCVLPQAMQLWLFHTITAVDDHQQLKQRTPLTRTTPKGHGQMLLLTTR